MFGGRSASDRTINTLTIDHLRPFKARRRLQAIGTVRIHIALISQLMAITTGEKAAICAARNRYQRNYYD
jgi:hypothetical protein